MVCCAWLQSQTLFHLLTDFDADRALATVQAALAVMEGDSLHFFTTTLHATAAMVRLVRSELDLAAAHLARAVPALDGDRLDVAWYIGAQAWLTLLQGQTALAVQQAQRLVQINVAVGAAHPLGVALVVQANALAAAGLHAQALDSIGRARSHVTRLPVGRFTTGLVEADLRLMMGDTTSAEALLRQAWAAAREGGVRTTLQWLPEQMSRLCAFALERGVEAECVRDLVRRRGIRPPCADPPGWPWPIKVRCLGGFEILKDDEPLRFEGKAQRRPLAMLKALIALGARDVPEDRLIEAVWAEPLEGDEQKAFDVTVHRLRKLLGLEKSIHVSDRHVSLNPELVWVDLWALERWLVDLAPIAHRADAAIANLEHAARAVLDLYRGHFLACDAETAWVLPVRNRLSGRFQRFVLRLGQHWEGLSEWTTAAELYQRSVELDPLAELFYRKLMVCMREQGRRAEAMDVFRRCRQMLSVTLGVKPAEATEEVYRGLLS
jgi:LuxR family transcriptional regulator, maltose regulon positive regulatory protein